MTDEDAFVHRILDNPDDDAVRLEFADWLEKNGRSSHAELIRVQCELAGLPKGAEQASHRKKLKAREKELLSQPEFAPAWPEGKLITRSHPFRTAKNYERGFISENFFFDNELMAVNWAVSPWHQLLREGKILGMVLKPDQGGFEDASSVEGTNISSTSALPDLLPPGDPPNGSTPPKPPAPWPDGSFYQMKDLAEHPSLNRVTLLDLFEATLTENNLGVLVGSPSLTQLRKIYMIDCTISLDVLRTLVTSPSTRQLRILFMQYTRVSDYKRQRSFAELWEIVASSPNMASLETLWIDDLDEKAAEALINSPYLKESLRIAPGYTPNGKKGLGRKWEKEVLRGELDAATVKALRKRYPGTRF